MSGDMGGWEREYPGHSFQHFHFWPHCRSSEFGTEILSSKHLPTSVVLSSLVSSRIIGYAFQSSMPGIGGKSRKYSYHLRGGHAGQSQSYFSGESYFSIRRRSRVIDWLWRAVSASLFSHISVEHRSDFCCPASFISKKKGEYEWSMWQTKMKGSLWNPSAHIMNSWK